MSRTELSVMLRLAVCAARAREFALSSAVLAALLAHAAVMILDAMEAVDAAVVARTTSPNSILFLTAAAAVAVEALLWMCKMGLSVRRKPAALAARVLDAVLQTASHAVQMEAVIIVATAVTEVVGAVATTRRAKKFARFLWMTPRWLCAMVFQFRLSNLLVPVIL